MPRVARVSRRRLGFTTRSEPGFPLAPATVDASLRRLAVWTPTTLVVHLSPRCGCPSPFPLYANVAEHVASPHRKHAKPAFVRPRRRWSFNTSKPVRCGSPTVGRFDSGAAPSSRSRRADGPRGAPSPTFGIWGDAARDRSKPRRAVADCGANVARSRSVRPMSRQATARSRSPVL
jgi:hypothetical protein